MMHTYTVTIGRNVGDVPMSEGEWAEFKRRATKALDSFGEGADGGESHEGFGVWDETPEQSFKRTLLKDEPMSDDDLHSLKLELVTLARQFDQDAVALTIGQSELIYGSGVMA